MQYACKHSLVPRIAGPVGAKELVHVADLYVFARCPVENGPLDLGFRVVFGALGEAGAHVITFMALPALVLCPFHPL